MYYHIIYIHDIYVTSVQHLHTSVRILDFNQVGYTLFYADNIIEFRKMFRLVTIHDPF